MKRLYVGRVRLSNEYCVAGLHVDGHEPDRARADRGWYQALLGIAVALLLLFASNNDDLRFPRWRVAPPAIADRTPAHSDSRATPRDPSHGQGSYLRSVPGSEGR